jgi:hypothetical protein
LSSLTDSHFNTQDEIINLISIEIGKDSKKKSDITMKLDELQDICDRLTMRQDKKLKEFRFQMLEMKEELESKL